MIFHNNFLKRGPKYFSISLDIFEGPAALSLASKFKVLSHSISEGRSISESYTLELISLIDA